MRSNDQETEQCIPDELRALRHWVMWRYEARPGKPKPGKAPCQPRSGYPARTHTPAHWGTYAQALARFQHGGWQGLGFVFTAGDPYCGIDLDGCRDPETEGLASWAWHVIHTLDSYTEASPSGRGLHILVKATLPDHAGRKQGAEGYSANKRIVLKPGLDSRRKVLVLLHELLHWGEDREQFTKVVKECQVEATSFVVAQYLGLEHPYSADYLTVWGTTPDVLRAQLEAVSRAATHMTLRLRPGKAEAEEPAEGAA